MKGKGRMRTGGVRRRRDRIKRKGRIRTEGR
jgi:hypothetical protein